MREWISFSLNGCATNVKTLVKNKTVHTLSSNHWSVTENNTNNAWNVNFNNGNTNNNNKNNSYVGRAVSALGEEELISWIEASDDCCSNKKTSAQCTEYRIRMEEVLPILSLSVKERTYRPLTSECFVVTFPKLREIFAAHFLDRIVQHWIVLRIEPLLEYLFMSTGDVSYNCRKGYGTLRAVNTLSTELYRITEGWTKDAWIGRFDISSFFMSIDKERLWSMLKDFIEKKYQGEDKETLMWLSEIVVRHRPQENCRKKGDLLLWKELPKNKSLFTMDGMAIGNITSQILANYYLNSFDEWAYQYCKERGGWYERFVDDLPVVLPRKEDVLSFHKEAKWFLENKLNLTLHPKKVYVQHVTKGVKFVGSILKPYRTYISNRTLGRFCDMLQEMECFCKDLHNKKVIRVTDLTKMEHYICACNSYLGFLKYNNSYALKRKIFGRLKYFWKVAYIEGRFNKVVLKKRFRLSELLIANVKKESTNEKNVCINRTRKSGSHGCKKTTELQHSRSRRKRNQGSLGEERALENVL